MESATLVKIEPGKKVSYKGANYRVVELLDLSQVMIVDEVTGDSHNVSIADLKVDKTEILAPSEELLNITDESWAIAKSRLQAIKPLVNLDKRSRVDVAKVAAENNMHTNTLYGWLKLYELSGLLSSLLPKVRRDRGSTKFDDEIEELIKQAIATEYLTKQKKSQRMVIDEVKKLCRKQNLTPPHDNTIRNRIKALSPELVASRRLGRKVSDNIYRPSKGKFPGADWPLAAVQIDHTKLDIILVDDHYRKAIGRPWITLAFDVYSRMVTGFYVSFDPPSAMTTGLCLIHSILPKEKWLAKYDINGEWPLWGLPTKVHVDNAKEFRGNMLQKACEQYNIDIEWRPVARPNFGAHVERVLGTFAKEIHALPGSTFSNIFEKGDYNSESKASLTLTEFEHWLANYVVNVYHQKIHSMIGMTPLAMYKQGILGDEHNPGCGLPAKIKDEERLKFDFMPYELRSIQDYGVVIDKVHYYHDVLRPWINAPEQSDSRKKRKFIFRRDPRDISQIWFYDPELHAHFAIPYRDTSHPAISIWELREAVARAEIEGKKTLNEHVIFEAYEKMREIELESVHKTKAARRSVQRRKVHGKVEKPTPAPSTINEIQLGDDIAEFDIEPFEEMDDWS